MHAVAESGPLGDATWAHSYAKNAPWCPLKENDGGKFNLIAPGNPDSLASQELRNRFFANWELHWAHVLEIEPACEISKFIRFLEHADSIRFWAHLSLKEWQLPYIFLATCDFPHTKKKTTKNVREEWIRYHFDSRVRKISDLWGQSTWSMTRASFSVPQNGGEPISKHIIDVGQIIPDPAFLERIAPIEEDVYRAKMKMYFPTELRTTGREKLEGHSA
jgi:hypothetical protein